MKNIYTYLALSIMVLLSSCSTSRDFAQGYTDESQDITYQQFYDGLSPYGNWVDYQNYGYVWVPNEQGFRPYYNNGRWVYTNYGWTWVSGYDWGWAPFHYGRWFYDDAYGWMWTPGYEWAPAWVSWRSGNGCYGWAPLGPGNNFDRGMDNRIPDNYWAFVPNRYINSPRINNYYINREKNVTIINNTTVINNTNTTTNKTVYVTGPSAPEVEKVTNEKIRPARVISQHTPGNSKVSGSVVSIYKPGIKQTSQPKEQVKPSRIVNLNDVRTRQQNDGAIKNEAPGKEARDNATPNNPKTRPAVINPQKNNNVPAANEKPNPVVEKPVQTQQPQSQAQQPQNQPQPPQHQAQQPQRVLPGDKRPDLKPPATNQEKVNEPQTPNAPQNQNKAPQQPPVINKQPPRVRVINQPPKTQENVEQNQNIPPAPVNRAPVRKEQPNPVRTEQPAIVRPQHFPVNKQPAISPVNRTPATRNQNTVAPREIRREAPQRERK